MVYLVLVEEITFKDSSRSELLTSIDNRILIMIEENSKLTAREMIQQFNTTIL